MSQNQKVRQTNCHIMIREKKKPSDESFVRKFRILPVFSSMYMIRIRFSCPRELIWKEFRRAPLRPEVSHKVSRDSCAARQFCTLLSVLSVCTFVNILTLVF